MSGNVAAIVGGPNVGKSTLFNRLTGKRAAIVDDTPGVTRDRLYGYCEWNGERFMLVDTGGLDFGSDDPTLKSVREQAEFAVDAADAIIFVVDVRRGVVSTDAEIASFLRKKGKPVVLCVNKCDSVGEPPLVLYEFYGLGLGEPLAVSAICGVGTGDLLDEVLKHFKRDAAETPDVEGAIKTAVIGKPNVGKSSLVNAILGEERAIVSEIPGTTRDATDSFIENKSGKFIFIDTAGLRRKNRSSGRLEKYSEIRTITAVERADACIIMIDAIEGFTERDSKAAGLAVEAGKGCIIAVNKWDAVEKNDKTADEYRRKLKNDLAFMSYAPIIFISAKENIRIDRLFELVKFVDSQNSMRISTGKLNQVIAEAAATVQPPSDKGRRLKIYYTTQVSTRPPTFVFFVNDAGLFRYDYRRYIDNRLREAFGLEGTPTRMIIRERESKRK